VGPIRIDAVFAESFGARLRGLAGREADALEPMLFPRCRSVHTFGMRAAIDVVWLDLRVGGGAVVLAIEHGVTARRVVRAPRRGPPSTAALELPAGSAHALGLEPGGHLALALPAAAR
jgi:uncharacterized protein